MAKVKIRTTIEGSIDKYDAFQALCEELGLRMLIDDNLRVYGVVGGTVYKWLEIYCFHNSCASKILTL